MTTVLETPTSAPQAAPAATTRRTWIGFAVILSAMILNILDSTIVNVAAPAIQREFALTPSALEWVAAGYTLALAVGIMAAARLGDLYGRKRMLQLGLLGFVAASLACSLAWSGEVLIAARVAQGLAAAVMVPQTFGLIRDVFPSERIGQAFAAFGPAIGMATILGPVVAGVLMKADLLGSDWRSLFWINVPVGIAAYAVGRRVLPDVPPAHAGRGLDVIGAGLFALGSFALIFPLVDGRTLGWPVWLLGLTAVSALSFAAFGLQQRRRVAAGRSSLVEFSILRKRSFVSGVVFTQFFFGSVVAIGLVMGLFLQVGLGFSAFKASLYLAGLAVGAFVGAGVGAWAVSAVGRPILHVGLSVMALATGVLWASLSASEGVVGFWTLAPGMTLFGLGMGMIFVPLFSIIMGEITDAEVGSASGLLESMQQLGASLGVAVLGTVFFHVLRLEDGGPVAAVAAGRHLAAVEHTLLGVLVAIGLAWLLGWLLPRRARAEH